MTINNQAILESKAKYFKDNHIAVHIWLRNGFYKRGMILSLHADFIMLDERLEGKVPVFFLEISDILAYVKKEKEEQGNGAG